jgi:hypothetical protein
LDEDGEADDGGEQEREEHEKEPEAKSGFPSHPGDGEQGLHFD